MSAQELLNQALGLSQADRAYLAHELLVSLDDGDSDEDSEEAWTKELERRLAEIESGNYSARDWEEVIKDIKDSLAKERLA